MRQNWKAKISPHRQTVGFCKLCKSNPVKKWQIVYQVMLSNRNFIYKIIKLIYSFTIEKNEVKWSTGDNYNVRFKELIPSSGCSGCRPLNKFESCLRHHPKFYLSSAQYRWIYPRVTHEKLWGASCSLISEF